VPHFDKQFIFRAYTVRPTENRNLYLINDINYKMKTDLMLIFEITNISEKTTKIYSYLVELKTKKGNWVPVKVVNWLNDYKLVDCSFSAKTCTKISLEAGVFDDVYNNNEILNAEVVSGWVFLALPKSINLDDYDYIERNIRIKLRDYRDNYDTYYPQRIKNYELENSGHTQIIITNEEIKLKNPTRNEQLIIDIPNN